MSEPTNKIHISYSEFSKYQECGHRHLIDKFLKLTEDTPSIHLYFGSSIHSAIELGIKNKLSLDGRIKHFKEMFTKEMMENMLDAPEFKDMTKFTEQGENILKILNIEAIFNKYDIVGVELNLYEKLYNNFHFKGFIDLVLKEKSTNRYLVIDWKTSTEPWDVSKKKKDEIFLSQMRLYKYFYSRKYNVPLDLIDCKYIVLNRLKSKKLPELGFGELQPVNILSNDIEIESSLKRVGETIRNIHILNYFPKAKINGDIKGCFFCPHKHNPTLCNENPEQYKELLEEHRKS